MALKALMPRDTDDVSLVSDLLEWSGAFDQSFDGHFEGECGVSNS